MEVGIESLIGAKVVDVDNIFITFDNGCVMTIHPYETFVEKEEE
ncbi:hypothetical protein [Bacillus subtilis]|nr:hypothetical protein [Bacillus subtilis]MDC6143667.1 hypothetical protein [Bacillus subtilis]MDM5458018.1 hypothetical protein [Bacillus subtilis]